jgi:hypothetical protein
MWKVRSIPLSWIIRVHTAWTSETKVIPAAVRVPTTECIMDPRQMIGMPAIAEAESKEKQGIWDPEPELTITSAYVDSRVDSNTCTMDNPMQELTLTLCQRLLYLPVMDLGFGLRKPGK